MSSRSSNDAVQFQEMGRVEWIGGPNEDPIYVPVLPGDVGPYYVPRPVTPEQYESLPAPGYEEFLEDFESTYDSWTFNQRRLATDGVQVSCLHWSRSYIPSQISQELL